MWVFWAFVWMRGRWRWGWFSLPLTLNGNKEFLSELFMIRVDAGFITIIIIVQELKNDVFC